MSYTEEEDISISPKSGRQLFSNWKKSMEGQMVISDMLRHQLGLCAICKLPLNGKYMVDHIFPLSKLTPDTMWMATHHSNLCLLCPPCNLKKGDKVYMIKVAGDVPDLLSDPLPEDKKTRKKRVTKEPKPNTTKKIINTPPIKENIEPPPPRTPKKIDLSRIQIR